MSDKLANVIAKLAHELGVAAAHVYGVLVRQAIVEGVQDIVLAVILGTVSTVLIKLAVWMFRKYSDNYDEGWQIGGVFVVIAAVVAVSLAITSLYLGIGELLNPEYYAIKDVLDALGGGK
jgi:uncharacterized membrane protein